MNRTVISRDEVIENVKMLYQYLKQEEYDENKNWAIERMVSGNNYVVDIIENKIYFGPSRIVGYKKNSIAKWIKDPGDGTETDPALKKIYKPTENKKFEGLNLRNDLNSIFNYKLRQLRKIIEDNEGYFEEGKDYTKLIKKVESEIRKNKNFYIYVNDVDVVCGKIQEYKLRDMDDNSFINRVIKLLAQKKNIILQGAPGTGKTYNTAAIAVGLIDGKENIPNDHAKVMKRYEELREEGCICFTTFHQSMDYEDFVEGFKPKDVDEDSSYSIGLKAGIFKEICKHARNKVNSNFSDVYKQFTEDIELNDETNHFKIDLPKGGGQFGVCLNSNGNLTLFTGGNFKKNGALKKEKIEACANGDEMQYQVSYYRGVVKYLKENYYLEAKAKQVEEIKNHVLIIDEINRGNVSKIFGELITLLEKDKREGGDHPISVTLPYSGKPFSVPNNLYIIGTMNTTDRSTGTLDYALRRRFAFVTLLSKREVIEQHYQDLGDEDLLTKSLDLYDDIKIFIEDPKHLCGDMGIDDLMVGHSYFMASDKEELMDKMEYEVVPLINEYINDGILNVSQEEKKEAFEQWKKLEVYKKEKSEQNAENDVSGNSGTNEGGDNVEED